MIYLHNFTFLSAAQESRMRNLETRKCFNDYYPFGILSSKGVGRIDFDPVTIFYGGNGSGKSTALNIIAARLKLLRDIPFEPTQFFDWTVNGADWGDKAANTNIHIDGVDFNDQFPDMWKGIPAESRIITSEDVFDKALSLRGRNREINRQREAAARKWWAYRVEGKHTNLATIEEGPEYEAWKLQHSMDGKTMGRFIREEVGFNIKTGSNGENAFEFFLEKMSKSALYLLDEPENSLSAAWQVKLAKFIEGMARFENCQFVIATHSPFVLGIKGAKIYNLDAPGTPVQKWTELQNVREYYDFFKAHAAEFGEN